MFSKLYLVAALLLGAISLRANAHTGITPALGVSGQFARSDVQRPSTANECGNVNVANTINTSTPVQAAANGTFTVTATNFNAGQDGSRQVTALVDASGAGTNFVPATVTQNGDKAPTSVGSQQIAVSLPSGTKCTGGQGGNLCLASFTTAGGFGNCVVVQQAAGAAGNNSAGDAATGAAANTAAQAASDSTAASGSTATSGSTAVTASAADAAAPTISAAANGTTTTTTGKKHHHHKGAANATGVAGAANATGNAGAANATVNAGAANATVSATAQAGGANEQFAKVKAAAPRAYGARLARAARRALASLEEELWA